MVGDGDVSSQRNRLGAENQTWPRAVSGCDSAFRDRVCTKSADQVCKFVCAENQDCRSAEAAVARAGSQVKTISAIKRTAHRPWGSCDDHGRCDLLSAAVCWFRFIVILTA